MPNVKERHARGSGPLRQAHSPDNLHLRKLQVALAIRLGRPRDPNAVTRRIATVRYRAYPARRSAGKSRTPPWIAIDASFEKTPADRWLRQHIAAARPALLVSDYHAIAIESQTPCLALLPMTLAKKSPKFSR